ncbi:MAG: DNA polymerase/3'-5' exonuclease PolX [Phycisphaerales bacterium]|nr:DNA polymerase/3'-5' exonuclease PolX [Phycisphaerales bacterium]
MATNTNSRLAQIFEQMAAALELTGANPFRVNSDARVARLLAELPQDVESFVDADPQIGLKRLCEIPGIGKGSAEKIVEFLETGEIAEHTALLNQVPDGLFGVLDIPGLGPKTVKAMWEKLGITSIEDLKGKLDSPELRTLPRMGEKTIENIRKALQFKEQGGQRAPLGIVRPVAIELVESLRKVKGAQRVEFAGSLRRGKETIGDIDILAACKDAEPMREAFCTHEDVTQVLSRGDTKCSVRLDVRGLVIQADLRLVPEANFGAAWLYFTGSKEHNVRLRERAIKKKHRLNEYGLYKGLTERPQDSGEAPVAAAKEADVYKALGLPYIPPEIREDRGELDAEIPDLIELSDIKAELHAHTTASDGKLTIDELIDCAQQRGYHTLAITDHSVSSVIANGLDVTRLRAHVKSICACARKRKDIAVLCGTEVDILPDGRLDYDDEVLASLDVVVASPHVSLRQDSKTATKRLLKAIENPYVHILGHPTGRMVGAREGLEPDMNEIIAAAKQHNVALEINANWKRLDLRDIHVRAAVQAGCLIAIDTDAHRTQHFDYLIYGVLTGRRGWLTAAQCINTWPAKKLHAWLKGKR